MYLVTGVTGHVGSVAASDLLTAGAKVRVLVRSAEKGAAWRERGAEVVVGDLGDVDTLAGALAGVEGAFLLIPPPGHDHLGTKEDIWAYQRDLVAKVASAVGRSKVPYVVLLSSIGAQHPDGTGPIQGLYHAEQALAATGVKRVFVRACSFMENHGGTVGAMKGMGIFPTFAPPELPLQQVATRDIGHVVARALRSPPASSEIINLIGPRDYSSIEIKDIFARALGKPLQLIPLPVEQAAGALAQAGLPPGLADLYAEMYQGASTGRVAYEPGAVLTRGTVGLEEVATTLVG